jgi:hypothetical protein
MIEEPKALIVAQVETISVLPRTMVIKPEQMKVQGADSTMHVVYGEDINDRKVWLATFIDQEEAMGWVQASKMFGRPVTGAVLAGEVKKEPSLVVVEKGGRMSDEATRSAWTSRKGLTRKSGSWRC